jgi:hypothetical protein
MDPGVQELEVWRFAGERPKVSQGRETGTIVGPIDLRRHVARVHRLGEERSGKSQGKDLRYPQSMNHERTSPQP